MIEPFAQSVRRIGYCHRRIAIDQDIRRAAKGAIPGERHSGKWFRWLRFGHQAATCDRQKHRQITCYFEPTLRCSESCPADRPRGAWACPNTITSKAGSLRGRSSRGRRPRGVGTSVRWIDRNWIAHIHIERSTGIESVSCLGNHHTEPRSLAGNLGDEKAGGDRCGIGEVHRVSRVQLDGGSGDSDPTRAVLRESATGPLTRGSATGHTDGC